MQAVIIIILVLAVLLVIFTLQNSVEISLNILFWEVPGAPMVLVLLCCVLIGYIMSAIYFYPRIWKIKKEYNQLIKFNEELKKLHELNHSGKSKKRQEFEEEETNPEGIEMDDDDDDNSFFKD